MDMWASFELWIGSAQVKRRKTVVSQGSGTRLVAVALARDKDDFASKVTDACYEQGLDVMSVGEIELYENRLRRGGLEEEVQQKATALTADEPIGLCLFD